MRRDARVSRAVLAAAFAFLLLPTEPARAQAGYVHGSDHCFHFATPPGWVADAQVAKKHGVPFAFYPSGGSWADSQTVMYARVAKPRSKTKSVEAQVEQTLADFRDNGSPGIKATKVGNVKGAAGATGELYQFTGDQWNNTELVAYFAGRETVNFFVMTSRAPADFEARRKGLTQLAESYREASDCKPCCEAEKAALPATLDEAGRLGDAQEEAPATRHYHHKVLVPHLGQKMGNVLRNCFETVAKPDSSPLHFVVAIGSDGKALRLYRDKDTNVFACLRQYLEHEQYPAPPEAPYFLHMKLKFTE
jgi:hypothetical protein